MSFLTTETYSIRSTFVDPHLQQLIDTFRPAPRMLDVSKLHAGQRCPRCVDRRVYAVDQDKNLWLCIASAMPVPWRRDQVTEHDATQDLQVTE